MELACTWLVKPAGALFVLGSGWVFFASVAIAYQTADNGLTTILAVGLTLAMPILSQIFWWISKPDYIIWGYEFGEVCFGVILFGGIYFVGAFVGGLLASTGEKKENGH